MKTLIAFISIISLINFGFSQSIQISNNTLEYQFVDADLSAENKEAFEYRAKQKVLDFCNYIQLISNKEYDEKFREHSKNTAVGLFNSTTCRVADSLIGGNQENLTVPDYFEHIFQTTYYKISCEASNLVLSKNLTQIDADNYAGSISYTRFVQCTNEIGEINFTARENRTVGVTLSRKIKQFGDTEKKIWVVSLCDVI